MNSINIRLGSKIYSDPVNFNYGFKKSGDFSITESDILSAYGQSLLGLEMGELSPETDEEKRFVQVMMGKAQAETRVEKTWVKYVRLSRTKRNFFTLYSSASKSTLDYPDNEDYDENDLEVEV
ncbi:DUF413 domain-containing protein [Paraglaciecola aquimarina]|uniref:Macrodomain Ori protein n=1 Tax=Paraglaciecola aquimarina TaxID=1235557 RepID=A0ABU3SUR0_9ALTE|nr:DUF413 domain-containing protein [Paraglaciecola aquimarina]MDU0353726.1 DUF413 domain-containing protein [Paraglaciecola aquimarina]